MFVASKREGPWGYGGRTGDSHCWAGEFVSIKIGGFAVGNWRAPHVRVSPVQIITPACISAVSAWGPVERSVGGPLSKQTAEGKRGAQAVSRTTEVFNPVVTCSPRRANKAYQDYPWPAFCSTFERKEKGQEERRRVIELWKMVAIKEKKRRGRWTRYDWGVRLAAGMMQHRWYSLTPYLPLHVLHQIHGSHHKVEKWPSAIT